MNILIMPPSTHHAAQAIICFPLHHGFNQVIQTQAGPPWHQAASGETDQGQRTKLVRTNPIKIELGPVCLLAVLLPIITCTKVYCGLDNALTLIQNIQCDLVFRLLP